MFYKNYKDNPIIVGWTSLLFALMLSLVSSCGEVYACEPELYLCEPEITEPKEETDIIPLGDSDAENIYAPDSPQPTPGFEFIPTGE